MTEMFRQDSQEKQAESQEIKTETFQIKDQHDAFPDWELNDETVKENAKVYIKETLKEEADIDVVSWKKLGVSIKNGVKWLGIEVKYSEK